MKINFELEKKISIAAPIEKVYQTISSLDEWNRWSPWIVLDPSAISHVSKDSQTGLTKLTWESKFIGKGDMKVLKKESNYIEYALEFYTPFRTSSVAWFRLTPNSSSENVEITWGMKSTLPFFLFFMKKMMVAYIGADYNRGLLRLKEYIETGKVTSTLSDVEKFSSPAFYVLGKKVQTELPMLAGEMTKIFDEATSDIMSGKLSVPDGFISLYYKFDLVKNSTHFASGIFYYQKPQVPNGYELIEFKNHQSLKMTLKGPYLHLATAWAKIFCYQRGLKIKINKKTPFYELYLNSPKMVAMEDITTELRLPIL